MSSSLVILFGVVKQFGRFWIWSETECKSPAEYGLQHNSPPPPPHTHTVYIYTVHKYSSFVHWGNSSQAGSKIPTNEWKYLQSIKSVKHNAANSVNRSILKKSRHIGFGVFIVHSSMVPPDLGAMHNIPSYLRMHTEWQRPLSGVYFITMEKLALAGEGGRCTPTPFHSIYHHVESCSVRSMQLGGQIHSPIFISTLCTSTVLCASYSTQPYTLHSVLLLELKRSSHPWSRLNCSLGPGAKHSVHTD